MSWTAVATSSSLSTSVTASTTSPALAASCSALCRSASHWPTLSATPMLARRSPSTAPDRKLPCTNVPRPRPMSSLRLGMIAVCGIGMPSGCLNRAVTANQSARAPTMPASAKART